MAFPSHYRHGIVDFINNHQHLVANRSIVYHMAKLTPLSTKIDALPDAVSKSAFMSKSDRFAHRPLTRVKREIVGPGRYDVVVGNISEKQRSQNALKSVRRKQKFICYRSTDSLRNVGSNIIIPNVEGLSKRSIT